MSIIQSFSPSNLCQGNTNAHFVIWDFSHQDVVITKIGLEKKRKDLLWFWM